MLQRLEFHKVIELLTECATFSLGREYCAELQPSTDYAEVLRRQEETAEAAEIYRKEPDVPLGGMRDTRGIIRKANIGGILEPAELLDVAGNLVAARRLKRFFSDRSHQYPIMGDLVKNLFINKELEEKISQAIDPSGAVADEASPELRRIRHRIRETEINIKAKMEGIIRSQEHQKFFQEPIITVRGDRYVVPVKQEYRGQFPGIIHDQSASGATLFIEPVAVVELNNELRKLYSDEEREVLRILTQLSASVKAFSEELLSDAKILGTIDFILAKGKLAHHMNASKPIFNKDGYINLRKCRHPLIKGHVVPIDIYLGRDFHVLVITGPNTGGKTVSLKTVGLTAAMAQAGLHIPCEPGSQVPVFHDIFVDIGDEQSIEQSLSTFSGHLKNIIHILAKVNESALVLLDELGAGTDPVEGAALAMAILEYLYQKKARTVATTHYSELKVFAFERQGVENASVEFDSKTLRPTYKLLIGQPGRSSAFEIALRLGLPEALVTRARSFLTSEEIQVADLVEELETNRRKAEEERRKAERLRRELDEMRRDYAAKLEALENRRKELVEKAREEAASIVRQARKEADELVKELRRYVQEKRAEQLAEAEEARNRLKELEDSKDEELMQEKAAAGEIPKGLKEGEPVFLPRFNQTGYVLTTPDENGQLYVQAGILKLAVHVSEVRRKQEKPAVYTAPTGTGKLVVGKAKEARTELDIRGKTVDEALPDLEKFLDDAYLAGLQQVQIIHGKGTGVLRKAVNSYLAKHKYVQEFRLGHYGEGGTGVTVIKLK
ncbi:endonuclease MutS2 [Thermincola ferriacetica]